MNEKKSLQDLERLGSGFLLQLLLCRGNLLCVCPPCAGARWGGRCHRGALQSSSCSRGAQHPGTPAQLLLPRRDCLHVLPARPRSEKFQHVSCYWQPRANPSPLATSAMAMARDRVTGRLSPQDARLLSTDVWNIPSSRGEKCQALCNITLEEGVTQLGEGPGCQLATSAGKPWRKFSAVATSHLAAAKHDLNGAEPQKGSQKCRSKNVSQRSHHC